MFFAVLPLLFQWLALYVAGGSLGFFLVMGSPISDMLIDMVFALFVWLLAKGISAMFRIPVTFKFLNTRAKKILAAIIIFVSGFILPLAG